MLTQKLNQMHINTQSQHIVICSQRIVQKTKDDLQGSVNILPKTDINY
jgi:hypothetical protein